MVPRQTKRLQIGGLVIGAASLIGSAFATQAWRCLICYLMRVTDASSAVAFSNHHRFLLPIRWRYVRSSYLRVPQVTRTALYLPCALLLYEWFIVRRGMASGIMFGGAGAGGTVFPFLVDGLLKRFGYKAAMISLGFGWGVIGGVALLAVRRRVPLARRSMSQAPTRNEVKWRSFALRRDLYLGMTIILFTSLGNFIPSVWIPGRLKAPLRV